MAYFVFDPMDYGGQCTLRRIMEDGYRDRSKNDIVVKLEHSQR